MYIASFISLMFFGIVWAQMPVFERKLMDCFEGEYRPVYGFRTGWDVKLVDIDGDGIDDMTKSDQEILWNQGTNLQPDYRLISYKIGLSDFSVYYDLNDDDLADNIFNCHWENAGWLVHDVRYSINEGTIQNPSWGAFTTIENTLEGGFSLALDCGDLNGDGLLDIIADKGIFQCFVNIGTLSSPEFQLDSTITIPGYPYPGFALCDIDNDGDLDLFNLSRPQSTRLIQFYRNIGSPQQPEFLLESSQYMGLELGTNTASIAFSDFDYDSDFDMTLDEQYYENVGTPDSAIFEFADDSILSPFPADLVLFAVFGDLDGDGDEDFIPWRENEQVNTQTLVYYKNQGTPEEADWHLANDTLLAIDNCFSFRDYNFVDMDADGDLDLLMTTDGVSSSCLYYENIGNAQTPEFQLMQENLWESTEFPFTVIDVDNDGDYDVLNSNKDSLLLVENIGTPQDFEFQAASEPFLETGYSNYYYEVHHTVADFDFDGDVDVLATAYMLDYDPFGWSSPYYSQDYYLNTGNSLNPIWTKIDDYHITGLNYIWGGKIYDLNQDGYLDIFAYANCSRGKDNLHYYQGTSLWSAVGEEKADLSPQGFDMEPCFPNPFNNTTNIVFTLDKLENLSVKIFDIQGREVELLGTVSLSLGRNTLTWNAGNESSGIYFIRIQQNDRTAVRKAVLLK